MGNRIKGQEVEVVLIADGSPQRNFTAVRSFEFEYQQEIQSEQYLGETTNRKDTIFQGVRGRIEFHIESSDAFDIIKKIIDKARDRSVGTQINIKATLCFPNGDRSRVIISDAEFGAIPITFSDRSSYGNLTFEYEASEAPVIQ